MLSKWPVTRTTTRITNGEQLEEIRATANLSRVVENDTPLGIPLDLPLGIPLDLPLGINFENTAHMKSRKATVNQSANIEVSQKSQRKIPKAQRQFRKAIIYIFIALLMCYLPLFVSMFYFIANKHKNGVLSVTSFIGIQLNSCLNAIILIAFSKEIRRKIKAIVVRE